MAQSCVIAGCGSFNSLAQTPEAAFERSATVLCILQVRLQALEIGTRRDSLNSLNSVVLDLFSRQIVGWLRNEVSDDQ